MNDYTTTGLDPSSADEIPARFTADQQASLIEIIQQHTHWQNDKERMASAIRKGLPEITRIILALEDGDKANAPKLDGPPPACAPVSRIRAVQASLWDNWKDSEKQGIRWGLSLEVWDDSRDKITLKNFTFKSQGPLMTGKLLKAHIRKNMKGKQRTYDCSAHYIETLEQIADNMGKDQYVSLLNTNVKDNGSSYQRGRAYHDYQLVFIEGTPETGIERAELRLDGDALDINHFSGKPYGKKPFAPKVVLQSRVDLCDFFPLWASNSLGDDE